MVGKFELTRESVLTNNIFHIYFSVVSVKGLMKTLHNYNLYAVHQKSELFSSFQELHMESQFQKQIYKKQFD